jgi:dGTP triphosphohydrolase
MAEPTTEVLQEQIAALEQQLAQKRTEAGADASAPYERAEVHAAVGEQIKQVVPSYQPAAPAATISDVPSYQDPAIAQTVQDLVNVAFTQSIQQAITQAAASKNAAIVDALHDVLADQLHQELLNRHKIEPAP